MDEVQRQHERLLKDVPTADLIAHLSQRMENMALAYTPLIDPENIYTIQHGEPAECEDLGRTLVHAAVERSLP